MLGHRLRRWPNIASMCHVCRDADIAEDVHILHVWINKPAWTAHLAGYSDQRLVTSCYVLARCCSNVGTTSVTLASYLANTGSCLCLTIMSPANAMHNSKHVLD